MIYGCRKLSVLSLILLTAGLCSAAGSKLPELEGAMVVVPRGHERAIHPGQAFLGGSVSKESMKVTFSWDARGLVASFDCEDENIVAVQGAGRDNAASWKDDCVELLLDPGHEHGVPTLIRLSAAGALWDGQGTDAGYNIEGLTGRVTRTDKGWRGRIEIPWSGLGVKEPVDGEVWGMNVRNINHTGAFDLKTIEVGAYTPPNATESQDALRSGHIAFILSETAEDDARLAAMRKNRDDAHDLAIHNWAGPNDGNVITLGDKPVAIPELGRIGSGTPGRVATSATISHDGEALLVTFDCEDSAITAKLEGRDNGKLWRDDSVYVWLDPAHDHKGMIMIQVSAGGVINDSKAGDSTWNLEGLVADVKKTDKGWSAKLRIPFAGLSVPAPPLATRHLPLATSAAPAAVWGFNLSRTDHLGEYKYELMEMSSLALIPGADLGKMYRWGHLAFGNAADPAASATHVAEKKEVAETIAAQKAAEAAEFKRLAAFRGVAANPNANEDVRKIVKWFANLHKRNENRLLPANDIWDYGEIDGKKGMDAGYIRFVESIHKETGKWLPMIHVSYGDPTSVTPVAKDAGTMTQANRHAIAYWKAGGLVHIHVNPVSPFTGVYGSAEALKGRERIAEVLEAGTAANQRWMQTVDAWAELLTELRDAGVVVLWRPLHEMGFTECYWYDWGATRSGETYIKIWQHMFKYYSEEKKLDNLVWVWGGGGDHSLEMYPGPEYVDMVGFSHYGSDTIRFHNEYEHMLKYNKPLGFTEFGGRNLGLTRSVRELYPMMTSATYWHSWPLGHLKSSETAIIDSGHVKALMDHPWVMDRDEVDWRDVEIELDKKDVSN